MDAFFGFGCNICYKTDDGSLRDISKANMKHLKDTLITFVGNADIIKYKEIYLCQLCCEELIRFDIFREMCFSRLIQLPQKCCNILSKLDFGEDIKNVMIRRSERTKLEIFDISNVSDTSQIQFMKEEIDLNDEIEGTDSEIFTLTSFENKSGEQANLDVKAPVVNDSSDSMKQELHVKQENSHSEEIVERIAEFGDGVQVAFQIANVCTILNVGNDESKDIGNQEGKIGVKLRSTRRKNTLPAATVDAQPSEHVRQYRNRRSSKVLQSDAHNRVYPCVEAHTCTVCNKSFRSSRCLTRHARMHNDGSPYKCTVCNKKFTQSWNLTIHERIHSGDRPYKCTICNKTFTQSASLTTHKRIHSGVRPFKCNICNKTFRQLTSLNYHERKHSGAKPYKCTICNKTFGISSNLTRHERIHSSARPFKCTICNKTFTQSASLTTHKRIHSGVRPFKCNICNKTFTQSANLTNHERIHSGAKPYKCTICNKTFGRSSYLTGHKRVHSGARPYKCTICNKTFAQSATLTNHERIHSGTRAFKCTICNKTFKQSSSLNNHEAAHSTSLIEHKRTQ